MLQLSSHNGPTPVVCRTLQDVEPAEVTATHAAAYQNGELVSDPASRKLRSATYILCKYLNEAMAQNNK